MPEFPQQVKVIAFDADDTLWENTNYFIEAEAEFCKLMLPFSSVKETRELLYEIEVGNIDIYGYGVKSYILSMIEAAGKLSVGEAQFFLIQKILDIGKEFLNKPVELLEGIATVLPVLKEKDYRLVVATKGDLLDQENKLERSGLAHYFHHIEVMSDKQVGNYQKLLNHLDISANEFVMIGNSMRSDILPVLNLGAYAIHVPFQHTWAHEEVHNPDLVRERFFEVEKLQEILDLF